MFRFRRQAADGVGENINFGGADAAETDPPPDSVSEWILKHFDQSQILQNITGMGINSSL